MQLLEDNSDAVAGRLEVDRKWMSFGRVGRDVDWKGRRLDPDVVVGRVGSGRQLEGDWKGIGRVESGCPLSGSDVTGRGYDVAGR